MNPKIQDALNAQIQAELYSAYLYLAMAAHCESKNFPGAGHWLRLQHKEETEHGVKIMDHLISRGGQVKLGAIEAPPADFGSLAQVFDQVVRHEVDVTARIHKLYELAVAEKDYAAQPLLHWYIAEQIDEEAAARAILDKLKYCEERPGSVVFIDRELGKREA